MVKVRLAGLMFVAAAVHVPQLLAAQAGGAAVSAPVRNVAYEVAFTRENALRSQLHVQMSFDADAGQPVLLSLPAWTPGAYEISNFAKWVTGFAARAGAGESAPALKWDKVDYDTWRITPATSGRTVVSFDFLADTLDNAMSWSRTDFALFNGTNVFMYPEGRPFDWSATVRIRTDSLWSVATGMKSAGAPLTYTAANYHELVDMPFFVGRFDLDSAQVDGKWLRLATYPRGSVQGAQREGVWDQLKRFVPVQSSVFGETPWETYTVMQIADDSYAGASGLEHANSHVNVITPFAIGHPFMASLYAHEIFHAWNVKRLRPADLWPYRYDIAQPTTLLWMSEGITDYYADLSITRSGLADSTAFLGLTSDKINEISLAAPVALEDASLNTWIQPVDGTGLQYYSKGALAGFMLDIMIRDATDNAASLDHVLRDMYSNFYKQGRGFSEADWWSTVSRIAGGRNFDEFRAKYVDGREEYPWEALLPLAGIRLKADTIREPKLGLTTVADSTGGVVVAEVEAGSAAQIAGVRTGDVLLAVGEIMLTDPAFLDKFREKYATGDGADIPIRVQRGGAPVSLVARAQFNLRVQRFLEADSTASEKAARIRSGLFRGGS